MLFIQPRTGLFNQSVQTESGKIRTTVLTKPDFRPNCYQMSLNRLLISDFSAFWHLYLHFSIIFTNLDSSLTLHPQTHGAETEQLFNMYISNIWKHMQNIFDEQNISTEKNLFFASLFANVFLPFLTPCKQMCLYPNTFALSLHASKFSEFLLWWFLVKIKHSDSSYWIDQSGERYLRLTDFTLSPTITPTPTQK